MDIEAFLCRLAAGLQESIFYFRSAEALETHFDSRFDYFIDLVLVLIVKPEGNPCDHAQQKKGCPGRLQTFSNFAGRLQIENGAAEKTVQTSPLLGDFHMVLIFHCE